MENQQSAVKRIFEQLEAGNLDIVMETKDLLLKLEETDLKMAYERGVIDQLYKSILTQGWIN